MIPSQYTSLQQHDDFGLNFSNQIYSVTLTASASTALTMPGTAPRFRVVIKASADATVYAALNATATVPAGSTFAATSSELIPVNGVMCREVWGTDVIHFITAGTSDSVTISLYSVQSV
jgi:hypothetical protein